jgi:hypothetical protein
MKLIKNQLVASLLFLSTTLFYSPIVVGFFGDDDDDVIWQVAPNNYLKYSEQDVSSFGGNEHPVELDEKEISDALKSLTYQDKSFIQGEVLTQVFSISQIKILSKEVLKGLKNAKPEQDIIFVLPGSSKKLLVLSRKTFIAGRVFYKEGKLNIILGEYNLERNEAFERVLDPGDTEVIAYNFNFGNRARSSNRFKANIIGVTGVEQKNVKGSLRKDWFVIDVKLAADSYLADKNKKETPITNAEKELQRQSAQIAKQRREMRVEMARMRKQMEQKSSSSGGASAKSIEERITTLDQLLKKELITQEEYNSKRKEILGDI